MDSTGHRWVQCEACYRYRPESCFPSSVLTSIAWHVNFPSMPRRRTIWSCKECRAQEVAERERVEAFRNFRLPDTPDPRDPS